MIVLDASVLIAYLDGSDRHHAKAKSLLEALSGEPWGVSSVTLAEMRAEMGIKMPDCCVLQAAQDNDAAVASFDVGLLSAAQQLGLKIAA